MFYLGRPHCDIHSLPLSSHPDILGYMLPSAEFVPIIDCCVSKCWSSRNLWWQGRDTRASELKVTLSKNSFESHPYQDDPCDWHKIILVTDSQRCLRQDTCRHAKVHSSTHLESDQDTSLIINLDVVYCDKTMCIRRREVMQVLKNVLILCGVAIRKLLDCST